MLSGDEALAAEILALFKAFLAACDASAIGVDPVTPIVVPVPTAPAGPGVTSVGPAPVAPVPTAPINPGTGVTSVGPAPVAPVPTAPVGPGVTSVGPAPVAPVPSAPVGPGVTSVGPAPVAPVVVSVAPVVVPVNPGTGVTAPTGTNKGLNVQTAVITEDNSAAVTLIAALLAIGVAVPAATAARMRRLERAQR